MPFEFLHAGAQRDQAVHRPQETHREALEGDQHPDAHAPVHHFEAAATRTTTVIREESSGGNYAEIIVDT